jgi:Calcium binding
MRKAELDALVADATVDCYDEDEQASGLYNMIEDNLALPFQTQVLGVDVTVENIELMYDSRIVAVCARGETRQAISLADLPLPDPGPEGAEWIDAYRHWAG